MAYHLLIIEDDPHQQVLYRTSFERVGDTVVVVSGGREGLAEARRLRPDAIMLDIVMEGMDGFAVLERLKADGMTALIPVIIMTNLTGEEVEEECRRLGAVGVLFKASYTPHELVARAHELLGGKK